MNAIQGWRKIIATPERAKKLLKQLSALPEASVERVIVDGPDGLPVGYLNQRKPAYCPSILLYGQRHSDRLYRDADLRPALDAWDTGEIDKPMIRRICTAIIEGN